MQEKAEKINFGELLRERLVNRQPVAQLPLGLGCSLTLPAFFFIFGKKSATVPIFLPNKGIKISAKRKEDDELRRTARCCFEGRNAVLGCRPSQSMEACHYLIVVGFMQMTCTSIIEVRCFSGRFRPRHYF